MKNFLDKIKIDKTSLFKKTGLFLFLFFVFIALFLVVFYFINPLDKFNKKFFKSIPYPLVSINKTSLITTKDLLQDTESLKKFYDSQDFSEIGMRVDFKTEEGKKRLKIKEKEVLNKLIENKLIEKIANSKGIFVSEKEAGIELVTKAKEAGTVENLALSLRKTYNWSLSDFRDKVIIPRTYLNKLMAHYNQNLENQNRDRIETAYKKLEEGASFREVVAEYSEGETAEEGGELGWFKKKYLVSEIEKQAYSMNPGEFSSIITTSLGSHIIYLEEVRGEDSAKEVKLKQIFTSEGNFLNWLNNEKEKYLIRIFNKGYYWNKDLLEAEFTDQSFRKEEDYLRIKSSGDPIFN